MDELKEHYRGTFLPVSLMRLYESRTLNGEEVLLFTKIDALQDPKAGGCWASNDYLGKWWGKSVTWVSKTVSKFQDLNMIKITQLGDGRRIIRTPQISLNKTSSCSLKKTSTKVPLRERGERTAVPAEPPVVLLKDLQDTSAPKFSAPVRDFANWSRSKGFHVRLRLSPTDIKYTKGGGPGGWSRDTLLAWEKAYQEFLRRVPAERVSSVLSLYVKEHVLLTQQRNAPVCQTFLTFLERFDWIDRVIRQLKQHRKREGLDEEIAEDEDWGVAKPMSPDEQKKFNEDMRKIQFPTGEE
jgi:hypothetical protein